MARKLKAQKPPLSAVDKCLYLGGILFFFLLFSLIFYLLIQIPGAIALRNGNLIAVAGGSVMVFLAMPFYIFSTMTPTIILALMMGNRQPILGNKRFKPKFGQPVIKSHPLFSRAFRESLTAANRKTVKRTFTIIAIVAAATLLLTPFGIYPRAELDDSNILTKFDFRNQISESVSVEDADKIKIYIGLSGGRRSSHRAYLAIDLVFGKEEYTFTTGAFRNLTTEDALTYMIYLKGLIPEEKCEISRIDRMARLLDDCNYSPAETALVYELFEYNDERRTS